MPLERMNRSKDFYRRVIRTYFLRVSKRELTRAALSKEALFIIGRSDLENIWLVLDELVDEGHFEYDAQKDAFRMKNYVF